MSRAIFCPRCHSWAFLRRQGCLLTFTLTMATINLKSRRRLLALARRCITLRFNLHALLRQRKSGFRLLTLPSLSLTLAHTLLRQRKRVLISVRSSRGARGASVLRSVLNAHLGATAQRSTPRGRFEATAQKSATANSCRPTKNSRTFSNKPSKAQSSQRRNVQWQTTAPTNPPSVCVENHSSRTMEHRNKRHQAQ